MFVQLSELSKVSLGFKSLQNSFFYVSQATIDTYRIEKRFLNPIMLLKDMNSNVYWQSQQSDQWLFDCKNSMSDLRGTGARSYIEAMSGRTATSKKQSGRPQTIRQALEAQGSSSWYAPKAHPHKRHVWLRKAIDGTFAPYLFESAALVDQRCNSLVPDDDIDWKELAAILTSTLFAYSVEINGAAMGAGALEAATKKLRNYPVVNIRALSSKDRDNLLLLANAVWKNESPINWYGNLAAPGSALQELDAWLLYKLNRNVSTDTVYKDLRTVVLSRISVARDKVKKRRKRSIDSTRIVAESITKAIQPKLQIRNFPDDFAQDVELNIKFNFDRSSLSRIVILPFMDRYEISILTKTEETVFEGSLFQPVAEAIIRSILWGRSVFSVSYEHSAMLHAVSQFVEWVSDIEAEINVMIADSSLGTGYEDALRAEVFSQLGIHPMVGQETLPTEIYL